MSTSLTPEQESVAHKIDTAGLALIGAGVAGDLIHRHAPSGGALSRFGAGLHHMGPYLDLAGLAMIAPPAMHAIAKQVAPEKPKELPLGEIPVAGASSEGETPITANASTPAAHVPTSIPGSAAGARNALEDRAGESGSPSEERLELERAKLASYVLGARTARRIFGDSR